MQTSKTYLKECKTEREAVAVMRIKNASSVRGPKRVDYVIVDGPRDLPAVMDIRSAISAGLCYRWS